MPSPAARPTLLALAAVVLAGAYSTPLHGQFEGSITMREVEVHSGSVLAALGGDLEPEAAADALLAASVDDVIARARARAEVEGLQPDDALTDETSTLHVRGDAVRQDVPEAGSGIDYVLLRRGGSEVIYVSDSERFFVRMDIDSLMAQMKQQMEAMGLDFEELMGGDEPGPPARVEQAGSGGEVNGRACENVRAVRATDRTLACVASGFESVVAAMKGMFESMERMAMLGGEAEEDPAMIVVDRTGQLPLRVVTVELSGQMGVSGYSASEMVGVEEASLPADFFDPPAGYEERSMQQMMGVGG